MSDRGRTGLAGHSRGGLTRSANEGRVDVDAGGAGAPVRSRGRDARGGRRPLAITRYPESLDAGPACSDDTIIETTISA